MKLSFTRTENPQTLITFVVVHGEDDDGTVTRLGDLLVPLRFLPMFDALFAQQGYVVGELVKFDPPASGSRDGAS